MQSWPATGMTSISVTAGVRAGAGAAMGLCPAASGPAGYTTSRIFCPLAGSRGRPGVSAKDPHMSPL